jgi:GAF domain-containing protein
MGIGHTEPKRRSRAGGGLSSVPRLEDEREYLYEIIKTIGSGPDLDTILAGVVRLATEATHCHACLIWFVEGDGFALRASSAPYAHLAGTIEMGSGEGLVGWVAKTRRSAFIKESALEDPRVKYFPQLEEEDFQSLVSVPILGRGGDVMGVISLHAEAPHEFARADLDFLEHTASLMAGAVENAHLYEESTARVDLLTNLSRLSQRVAAAGGIEEVLSAVSTGTRELLSADRCEIYLMDMEGRLRLAAASPPRSDAPVLDAASLWPGREHDGSLRRSTAVVRALWGAEPLGTPLVVPLAAGDEELGLIASLTSQPPPGAEMTLRAVAAHAAVAIRQHELVERLLEKNLVKDFFQALSRHDPIPGLGAALAGRLGCELDEPHVIVHIASWPEVPGPVDIEPDAPKVLVSWTDLVGQVESRLAARVPGALFDRVERSVRALMPASEGIEPLLEQIRAASTQNGTPAPLSIGVSSVYRGSAAYAAAFDEAAAAAEIGGLLRTGPGVTAYEELGAYKYVLGSPAGPDDRDQRRLERLVSYDLRRGTGLLDTLEAYLDNRGNVVGTARTLYIHPNTLRQRLERIQHEAGIDFDRDDWLSLAVAVKVVKLRRMRASVAGQRGNGG